MVRPELGIGRASRHSRRARTPTLRPMAYPRIARETRAVTGELQVPFLKVAFLNATSRGSNGNDVPMRLVT
jgi:hypothetical protein